MTLMELRAWMTGAFTGCALLLVIATFTLAAGFCLFHTHCGDNPALDLCLSVLVGVVSVLLASRLRPSGRSPAVAFALLPSRTRRVLDPPPKLAA